MPKVRLSNGTVVDTDQLNWSPSAGGGTLYDATRLGAAPFKPPPVPAPIGGLTTRKVQTYGVAPDGTPIVPSANGSAFSGGWGSTGFVLPGMNRPTQTAMLPYPEDSRTTPPLVPPVNDPFKTFNPAADQSRLPPSPPDIEGDAIMQALYPQAPQNPAVGAIDQATNMPRRRPDLVMPFMPSPMLRSSLVPTGETLPGATNFDGSPVEITVRGGNAAPPMLRNAIPPPVPAPRLRASPETFAKNRAAAEAALAIDMAGGSTNKTGKYAKATPRKDRLAARDGKQR